MTTLSVDNLETSQRVQVRSRTDEATVQRYAEAFEAGAVLPPVVVFRERDTSRFVIADGVHRAEAARRAGVKSLKVDLREGDETDALEYALGCNAEHGLQRTSRDIERAVGMLMTNTALTAKYRTHRERADLLKISERHFQRLVACWREQDGGTATERRAKAQARKSAEKNTPLTHKTDHDTCHGPGPSRSTRGSGRTSRLRGSERPAGPRRAKRIDESSPDVMNLHDLRTAVELLALFPLTAHEAAEQFASRIDREQVARAHTFLGDLMEDC